MKAYKVELLVIDGDDIGEEEIKNLLEEVRPLYPRVMSTECKDIGESHYNSLNYIPTQKEEYNRLFKDKK